MKILITGGAGFLGSNICIAARQKGHQVVVMDNFVRKGSDRNARFLEKRHGVKIIHGETRLEQDWKEIKADAIIHLAGQPGIPKSMENPVLDFQVNALGTLYGLEHARRLGNVPFLYASTNKVYSDEVNDIRLRETETRYEIDDPSFVNGIPEGFPMDSSGTHPHSPYGVSKASGDLLTQEYYHAFGVPTVAFRMSCIYGLFQNGVSEQGWADYFIRQRIFGDNKLIFYGNGKQVRDCLFGTDAANAYLTALDQIDKAKGKIFNLGGGKFNISLIEFVDILNEYTDKPAMRILYADWRLADHRVYISNTAKIERELGWKAEVDVEDGINQIVRAYQDNFYNLCD
jgi:CDP-paratose 2-epimerase